MIYFAIGMFALALALTMLTLRHRRRRGQNIEWSEQVTVLRIIPEQVVHGIPEEVAWDGITLDVAVERYMALPPAERAGLMILTQSRRAYNGRQIEALFDTRRPRWRRSLRVGGGSKSRAGGLY